MDVNAIVAWVLQQSFLQTQSELKAYAEKVEYHNKLRNQLRQNLERLRSQRTRTGSTSIQAQQMPAGPSPDRRRSLRALSVSQ